MAILALITLILLIAVAHRLRRGPSTTPPPISVHASQRGETCALVRVVDGDTIKVSCGGARLTVRLLRINTPERDAPGFTEATHALKTILGNGPVTLENEINGRAEQDRFGRRLAYVYVGSTNANVEIVKRGWSRFWTKYGPGRLKRQFEKAEKEARAAESGLWAYW